MVYTVYQIVSTQNNLTASLMFLIRYVRRDTKICNSDLKDTIFSTFFEMFIVIYLCNKKQQMHVFYINVLT
jgi:hypothetical protein